tara:strand:- start:455 stop:1195 length:741 start_codon:yes stop_codon:yes gene_type:complete
MIKEDIIGGIVLARSGSKGIKNKNLLKLNGEYLTHRAISIALAIKKIDIVIFSSDSDKILNTFPNHDRVFKIKRIKKLSRDNTSSIDVLQNSIEVFEKNNPSKRIKYLVGLDPTAPLRNKMDIIKSINFFEKKKPDVLISVHKCQHNPYFSMLEKKDHYFKLCKSMIENRDPGSRQEVPKVYEINTIAWIHSRKIIIDLKKRISNKTLVIEFPYSRSIDIDTPDDIDRINFYINKKNDKNKKYFSF